MNANNGYYGLMNYEESYNLGDEVQSIAAKQYLSHIDYLVDRNTGKLTKLIPSDADSNNKNNNNSSSNDNNINNNNNKIKVIYNGWFDGQYCKFPPPESVDPLFVSFHINESDHSSDKNYSVLDEKKISFTPIASNISYFKKYEPIGCRDLHTVDVLTKNGISAYFTGCLTLTLRNRFSKRNNEILVVDSHVLCPELFKNIIPDHIKCRASYVCQALRTVPSHDTKMEMAQNLLDRIAQAKLVITSRLHTAMPCLAFDTPVIFLHNDLNDVRFTGLLKFLKAYTNGQKLDVDLDLFSKTEVHKSKELVDLINNLRTTTKKWINPTEMLSIEDPYPTPGTRFLASHRVYIMYIMH